MVFRFFATPDFDFLAQFARRIGAPVQDDLLVMPGHLGQGHIRRLSFGLEFKITLHSYVLNEDLVLQRNPSGEGNDLITFFFYSNEQPLEIAYSNRPRVRFSQRADSAIQVTSNDLGSTIRFPARHQVRYVVVAIKPPRLKDLLAVREPNSVLQTITGSGASFLFFESMGAETKQLLRHLAAIDMADRLSGFYMQTKVQELLYLLFRRLAARDSAPHQPVSSTEAARLLRIRNELLDDLSVPPVLRSLARSAAMSETKLKQLFKQTFGSSIYRYYQQARMEEAAFLLKEGRRSVAETGYELGFSNLSHFSRLFEKHYGLRPKQYSSQP